MWERLKVRDFPVIQVTTHTECIKGRHVLRWVKTDMKYVGASKQCDWQIRHQQSKSSRVCRSRFHSQLRQVKWIHDNIGSEGTRFTIECMCMCSGEVLRCDDWKSKDIWSTTFRRRPLGYVHHIQLPHSNWNHARYDGDFLFADSLPIKYIFRASL